MAIKPVIKPGDAIRPDERLLNTVQSGVPKSGAQKSGAQKSGAQKSGAQKSGVQKSGVQETRPPLKQVWDWLDAVPDPEIPVISVVELGIIRHIAWDGATLCVEITPTYSGCPASGVIALDIETALLEKGIKQVAVRSVLSPAWTTAWIRESGRQKLKAYGIVPPVEGESCAGMIRLTGTDAAKIQCPRCDSPKIERISQFGSTPCKASYRCKSCLEPFDYFKAL